MTLEDRTTVSWRGQARGDRSDHLCQPHAAAPPDCWLEGAPGLWLPA